jgi:hypothetical protein
MPALEAISLSELKPLDLWANASKGSLLQVMVGATPCIGVRFIYAVANGSTDGIVILSGEHMGRLALYDDLQRPAIDASELVEIVVRTPDLFIKPGQPLEPGMLFHYERGYYLWFNVLSGTGSGFVCVSGADQARRGEHVTSIPVEKRVPVARAVDVRKRKQPYERDDPAVSVS